MSTSSAKNLWIRVSLVVVCVLALVAATVATRSHWLPLVQHPSLAKQGDEAGAEADSHEGHDHAGHDEASSLELSPQAQRNIGLTDDKLQPIKLGVFTRTLNIPARIVELPGRTKVQVAAPMTGVVAAVIAVQGEAVEPGALLFKVRLTHEDLVQSQVAFLKTLGELDVEDREIVRLTKLDASGVIAGKRLLERQYSKQKLQAVLNAHRESLLLHGISPKQIDSIVRDRRLLRELEVRAPTLPSHKPVAVLADNQNHTTTPYICPMLCSPPTTGPGRCPVCEMELVSAVSGNNGSGPSEGNAKAPCLFTVQAINVNVGSMVNAGVAMAVLVDLDELFVEGKAFEHDAEEITHAARMQAAGEPGWDVTAVLENNGRGQRILEGLKIVYVNNEVESN